MHEPESNLSGNASMQIIKGRKIVDTSWQVATSDQAQAESDTPILPLEQWRLRDRRCRSTGTYPGILLQPDDQIEDLAGEIDQVPVIAINAAGFADGRVYTLASTLRETYHYRGELRALGAMPDNLAMLERCGFDAFELGDELSAEDALRGFVQIEPVYSVWQ